MASDRTKAWRLRRARRRLLERTQEAMTAVREGLMSTLALLRRPPSGVN